MIKPLDEGDEVQYVGNYVLRMNEPPSVGFVEAVEEAELVAALEALVDIGCPCDKCQQGRDALAKVRGRR